MSSAIVKPIARPGDLLERPARVDRGREDDEDEEERQHGLDHDAGSCADAAAERRRAEVATRFAARVGSTQFSSSAASTAAPNWTTQ